MNKKLFLITGFLFFGLIVVAGGVISLLLMNQSQDIRQRAAVENGTVHFTLSKSTMTLTPNQTDTFSVLINTHGAQLTGFSYRLLYPSSSGITVERQEPGPGMIGIDCTLTSREASGQQSIGASCLANTPYSNTTATPIATITLKGGTQTSAIPIMVTFDMSAEGNFVKAVDGENADIAAIPQGSLAITIGSVVAANANLSGLSISQGTLTPTFSPATTAYSASVANSIGSLTVTPVSEDAKATIRVKGSPVTSGQASTAQTLDVGINSIPVEVTAEDGTTKKSYSITVNRASTPTDSSRINITSTQNCNPNEFKPRVEILDNNQPKAGVQVEFDFNREKRNATTNNSGVAEVIFGLPAPGTQSLAVRPSGYAEQSVSISISACAAPTPTPGVTTVQCNQTCNSTRACAGGLSCVGGFCRNTRCQTDTTCTCNGTNVASQSGVTNLPTSGSVDRTLALFLIGGLLTLGGGQILIARHWQRAEILESADTTDEQFPLQ